MSGSRCWRWRCHDFFPLVFNGVESEKVAINFGLASIEKFASEDKNCVVEVTNGEVGSG